jgi:hypothetical protein
MLATAVERNWEMCEVDIINAYATSKLPKPVYMHVPKMLQRLPFITQEDVGKYVSFQKGVLTIQREQSESQTIDNITDAHGNHRHKLLGQSRIVSVEPHIDGTVHLEQGLSFQNPPKHKNKVCKVTGALYGLAHSAKTFHDHLHKWFEETAKMPASTSDKCLYVRRNDAGKVILVAATWVDDVLIAGEPEAVTAFRKEIATDFAIRDFGEPKDFVGCEIEQDVKAGIATFKQTKYIEKLRERYGVQALQGSGPFATMDYTVKLAPSTDTDTRVDPTDYRSIIGALHYCAHCTRPDIAASVSILSKFLSDPNTAHLKQARKVLAFLLWSKHIGLTWQRDSPTSQASNFRRVLGCPGSPRFHFQKPVWWLPMTGGHRGGDLQLHFPGPMAVSASADGRVPGF